METLLESSGAIMNTMSGSAIVPFHLQDIVQSITPYFSNINEFICEHLPESCNLGVKLLM